MIEFTYKNKIGSIAMGGTSPIKITAYDGLGIPDPEYVTVAFAAENGVTTVGQKDGTRTITLTMDFCDPDGTIRRKMSRVFHTEGELYCITNVCRRKIGCKILKMSGFEHKGAHIYVVTVQLICDYPYFSDFYEVRKDLYSQKNLVLDTFTLPCIFTTRINRAVIHNTGDKYVYPIVEITNNSDASSAAELFYIENKTTGAKISINHKFLHSETLTFDLATRRIKSNVSGDVTSEITNDTDLSAFYFDVGDNVIDFVTTAQRYVSAQAVFMREYYSAEV